MRMRKKPNLLPRMERASAVLTRSPEALRGRWLASFPGFAHLHLELGCGKGGFTCAAAAAMPDTLLAAVEKVPAAMVVADRHRPLVPALRKHELPVLVHYVEKMPLTASGKPDRQRIREPPDAG